MGALTPGLRVQLAASTPRAAGTGNREPRPGNGRPSRAAITSAGLAAIGRTSVNRASVIRRRVGTVSEVRCSEPPTALACLCRRRNRLSPAQSQNRSPARSRMRWLPLSASGVSCLLSRGAVSTSSSPSTATTVTRPATWISQVSGSEMGPVKRQRTGGRTLSRPRPGKVLRIVLPSVVPGMGRHRGLEWEGKRLQDPQWISVITRAVTERTGPLPARARACGAAISSAGGIPWLARIRALAGDPGLSRGSGP
jgi:hypothetical protein